MADDLKQSSGAVAKLVAGVSTGLDNTRVSLKTIARLESVGRNIEKIVSGLSLIVVQTTMLAVSGSVEAARAGEAGRGFAVVSTDIRNLAREGADSAEQIQDTVGGILEQIAALRRDLEQIVDSVEVEVQNNRSVVGALE
jgi:methyl-accepting chemotaxis protein